MKIFKLLFYVQCIILMLLCCSCGFFGEKEYLCELDTVDTVQIVRLDDYVEGEYRYDYTVLAEITVHSEFIERLNNLEHSINWGDPCRLDEGYVVIRIDYLNGDYDLLHHQAQWFNRSGVNQYGYFFFNEEQFSTLISDYLTK